MKFIPLLFSALMVTSSFSMNRESEKPFPKKPPFGGVSVFKLPPPKENPVKKNAFNKNIPPKKTSIKKFSGQKNPPQKVPVTTNFPQKKEIIETTQNIHKDHFSDKEFQDLRNALLRETMTELQKKIQISANKGQDITNAHTKELVPYFNELLHRVENAQTYCKELQQDLSLWMKKIMSQKKLTPHLFFQTHFLYLRLMEGSNVDEVEVIASIDSQIYDFALSEQKDKREKIFQDLLSSSSVQTNLWGKDIPQTEATKLENELRKYLPEHVFLPVFGESILEIPDLLHAHLDGIFYVGMPEKGLKGAHGLEFSPLGFAYHDYLHGIFQRFKKVLRNHILQHIEKRMKTEKSPSVQKISQEEIKKGAAQYKIVMDALKNYLTFFEKKKDKKSIAGLFFIIHEFTAVKAPIFEMTDKNLILKTLIEGTKTALTSYEVSENPEDPFKTDYQTGESSLPVETQKEVAEKLMTTEVLEDLLKQEDKTRKDLTIENSYSKNFLYVGVKKNEMLYSFESFPTMKRKINNMNGNEGILGYADITIQKENPIKKLTLVHNEILGVLTHLEKNL